MERGDRRLRRETANHRSVPQPEASAKETAAWRENAEPALAGEKLISYAPTMPAARAHWYFAPSTATGFSVV